MEPKPGTPGHADTRLTLPAHATQGAGEHTRPSLTPCARVTGRQTHHCAWGRVFRWDARLLHVCARDHKQAAFRSLCPTARSCMSPRARVCTCVCTSSESTYTVWPHGDRHLHRGGDLSTRTRSKGSVQRKLPETHAGVPITFWLSKALSSAPPALGVWAGQARY